MRPLLIVVCAVFGLFGCTRSERTAAVADRFLSEHFEAIRTGDTNVLLARYSPEYFRQPKHNRAQLATSLARLHAQGFLDYTIAHRDVQDDSSGLLVRLSCHSRYSSGSFEEDFELYRAAGATNFVITRHEFD